MKTESKTLNQTFTAILKAEVTGGADGSICEGLTDVGLAELYALSKRQGFAQVVASYLDKKGILNGCADAEKFRHAQAMAVYYCVKMNHDIVQMGDIFGRAEIPYVLLKGSVLRPFYPEEYMRTSNDIDILIRESDISRALDRLTEAGYKISERTYHDISVFSPSNIHIELHFSTLCTDERQNKLLERAWEHVHRLKGYEYAFDNDFFLFYFFSHMAAHFTSGGCGLRFLTDLWVIENKMGIPLSSADEMLKSSGLYVFANRMIGAVHTCFDGAEPDGEFEEIIEFMLSGGACGSNENRIAGEMASEGKAGTVGFLLSRLFLPYRLMKEIYPILKRAPILLPIYWAVRLFSKIRLGKAESAFAEIKTAGKTSSDKISAQRALMNKLGL